MSNVTSVKWIKCVYLAVLLTAMLKQSTNNERQWEITANKIKCRKMEMAKTLNWTKIFHLNPVEWKSMTMIKENKNDGNCDNR